MAAVMKLLQLVIIFCAFPEVFSGTCPCTDVSLCKPITTPPRQERYMFSTKKDVWKKYDWTKITTIALFRDWDPELYCFAHSKGVRVMKAGAFPVAQLNDTEAKKEWINNKTKEAMDNFADGFNIDIEEDVAAGTPQVDQLTELVKDMTDAFHSLIPTSQVSFDITFTPGCTYGHCFDAKAISEVTDFMIIMAYDEPSPQMFGPCIAHGTSPFNQTISGVEQFLKLGVSADKLVLGLPWYGYDYTCIDLTNDVCTVNCSNSADSRQVQFGNIQDLLVSRAVDGRQWDVDQLTSFFHYQDIIGTMHQVWYDDPESLSIKYAFATEWARIRGIALWNADLVDYSDIPRAKQQTGAMWDALPSF